MSNKGVKHFPTEMTWAQLTEACLEMSEGEAFAALEIEKNGKRRKSYMIRLYGRFSQQRAERERAAIIAWAANEQYGDH